MCLAVALAGCGIYNPYKRPEVVETADLYGAIEASESESLGELPWREVFTDPQLQTLIACALTENTDLQSAKLKIDEASAALQSARLAYLPSINLAPQGALSSFDGAKPTKTYQLPVTAAWQIDLFGGLTNAKRQARAGYELSLAYEQAVRTQLVAGVANLYYTLLMLDEQLQIVSATAEVWRDIVEKGTAMKEAGMLNEAAVSQYRATYYSVLNSERDLTYQRTTVENSLCSVLGRTPQTIARGTLAAQQLPEQLMVGLPVQMLDNRPDVRIAEFTLMRAFYATNAARSKLYPSITLSGSAGWTNSGGMGITNPGELLLNAAGSVLMPIFNARANQNQLKIMKAQQEEAKLSYKQTLLNAGAEVNNALSQCQSARAKGEFSARQVEALETAVSSTELLVQHTSTTYLEVLTARQSLLSARLTQVANRFDELQGVVNLYQALGGGREE